MKILYETGPDKISMGSIQFRCGEPKEVPDDIAEKILSKKVIPFKKVDEKSDVKSQKPRDQRSETRGQ